MFGSPYNLFCLENWIFFVIIIHFFTYLSHDFWLRQSKVFQWKPIGWNKIRLKLKYHIKKNKTKQNKTKNKKQKQETKNKTNKKQQQRQQQLVYWKSKQYSYYIIADSNVFQRHIFATKFIN